MVTVTIHVQSYNVCCGCLFDEQFKYRPRRFKLVIDCSVGFCMSRANSFVEYDRSGLSCDKYAALITTLRYLLVCSAQLWRCHQHLFQPFLLTDGVVTPFALSRFKDLTINSACRGSGSHSIQFLPPSEFQRTYRFRIRTSLASSRPAPRIARTFYRVMITHRTFNFTQRFTVTQGCEVISTHHHRCIKCLAM